MTASRSLLASLLAPLLSAHLAAPASAQVQVHAGLNQHLPAGTLMTRLDGHVRDRSVLSFWIADGDGTTEDHLLKWSDDTGLKAVGPLKTAAGKTYGWPSDLERINGTVYGIETFAKTLYTLDPATGVCTPIGSPTSYAHLFGLAYDRSGDKLYAVDQTTRKLLTFDRSTGKATVVLTFASTFSDIRGIAFGGDGKIYFCDDATETLQRINLTTKAVEKVLDLNDGPNAKVDEITFWKGQLFASYRTFDPATSLWSMQLAHLDFVNDIATPYGPVIDDCSAHSLLINSIPEEIGWVQVDGPMAAHVIAPGNVDSAVRFDVAGRYVFELQARFFDKVITSDQMTIVIDQGPIAPPGGNPPQTTK